MFVLAQTNPHGGLDETAPFYLLIISTKCAGRMTLLFVSTLSSAFPDVPRKHGHSLCQEARTPTVRSYTVS